MGRALLAFQSKEGLENYFRKVRLTALTEKTVTSKSALRNILAKVREERYAAIEDELDYGVVSVAVPIFNSDNEVIAAVNCSTSTARTDKNEVMGVRHKRLKALEGVQFHPESILTEGGKQILRNFLKMKARP